MVDSGPVVQKKPPPQRGRRLTEEKAPLSGGRGLRVHHCLLDVPPAKQSGGAGFGSPSTKERPRRSGALGHRYLLRKDSRASAARQFGARRLVPEKVPTGTAHSMRASAQITAPGAVTSMIVAASTRPNRQNRSTCSRMVPLSTQAKAEAGKSDKLTSPAQPSPTS